MGRSRLGRNSSWSLLLGIMFLVLLPLMICGGCFNFDSVPRGKKPAGNNKLLISMNANVYSVKEDGTQFVRILQCRDNKSPGVTERISYENATYSPDRKTIAFELFDEKFPVDSSGRFRGSYFTYVDSLCLADNNGKNVRRLANIYTSLAKGHFMAGSTTCSGLQTARRSITRMYQREALKATCSL